MALNCSLFLLIYILWTPASEIWLHNDRLFIQGNKLFFSSSQSDSVTLTDYRITHTIEQIEGVLPL